MLILDIKKAFELINAQYPWAKESALEGILTDMGADIEGKRDIILKIQKNTKKVDKSINKMHQYYNEYEQAIRGFNNQLKQRTGDFKNFAGSTDPIQGFADLAEVGGQGLSKMGKGFQDYTGSLHKSVGGISTVLSKSGAGLAGFAGVVGVYGALINEQEKSIRSMIDYGMAVGNLDLYTEMRSRFAYAGMSLNEGMQEFGDMIPIFAQLGSSSQQVMSDFVGRVGEMMQNQEIQRFGRTRQATLRAISEEVRIVQKYNSIQELNQLGLRKVLDRYDNSSKILTATAGLLGIQRDTLEKSRLEVIQDLDFVVAANRSQSEIIERLGDDGYQKLIDGRAVLVNGFDHTLGPNLAKLTDEALTRAVYDYNHNQDFYDNMSFELNDVLQLLGQDARASYIQLMQDFLDGEVTDTELVMRQKEWISSISENNQELNISAGTYMMNDASVQIAREIRDNSLLISEEYLSVTEEQLLNMANTVADFTDDADQSLEVVDEMKAAMRHFTDLLTPGFGVTGAAVDSFSTMIGGLADGVNAVGDAFGITYNVQRGAIDREESIMEDAAIAPRGTGSAPNQNNAITDQETLGNMFSSSPIGSPLLTESERLTGDSNALRIGGVTLYEGGEYGVNVNEAMMPLLDMSNASSMVRQGAQENLERLLRGPYAKMQEYYGGPLMINDAIAKHGTTRESSTPGSQHFFGNALDVSLAGMTDADKSKLVHAALRAGFSGFGFGSNILHVDVGPARSWDYGNASFAGHPVDSWKQFVAGNAELIQSVALEPLMSEYDTIVPSAETFNQALARQSEILTMLDEMDSDLDMIADDPSRQAEMDALLTENSVLANRIIRPSQEAFDDNSVEVNFRSELSRGTVDEYQALLDYKAFVQALREQAEDHDFNWRRVDEHIRREYDRQVTNE